MTRAERHVMVPDRRRSRRRQPRNSRLVMAAALVIMLLGVGFISTRESATPLREIVAESGQPVAIDLPDGGIVLLAPGSRLVVPKRFDGPERVVFLEGHAFFEIPQDDRPFVVQAGGVHLSALGTEFDLDAWPQAATVALVVRSGRVAVNRRAAAADEVGETVLSGGERGVIGADGHVHVFADVDVAAHLAWTTGIAGRRR